MNEIDLNRKIRNVLHMLGYFCLFVLEVGGGVCMHMCVCVMCVCMCTMQNAFPNASSLSLFILFIYCELP